MAGTEIRQHSSVDGTAEPIATIDELLAGGAGSYAPQLYPGDSAIYWTVEDSQADVYLVALSPDGTAERLFEIELEPGETGLVIDEHDGLLVIGGIGSAPPRGMAVVSVSVFDTSTQRVEEIAIDQFIPLAKADAGGGLQILTLP